MASDILLTCGIDITSLKAARAQIAAELQTWKFPEVTPSKLIEPTQLAEAQKFTKALTSEFGKLGQAVGKGDIGAYVSSAIKPIEDTTGEAESLELRLASLTDTTKYYKLQTDSMGPSFSLVRGELSAYNKVLAASGYTQQDLFKIADDYQQKSVQLASTNTEQAASYQQISLSIRQAAERYGELGNSYAKMSIEADKASRSLLGGINLPRLMLWAVGWTVLYSAIRAIINVFTEIVTTSIKVNEALASIRVANLETAVSFDRAYAKARETIFATAATSIITAKDLAEAYRTLTFEGAKLSTATIALAHVRDLMTLTGEKEKVISQALIETYGLFGDKVAGAVTESEKLARIADLLTVAFTRAHVSIAEYQQLMSFLAPTGAQVVESFDFLVSLLVFADNQMLQGRRSGMALIQTLTGLTENSQKLAEVFGIVFKPGEAITVEEILRRIQQVTLGLSETAKKDLLSKMFKGSALQLVLKLLEQTDLSLQAITADSDALARKQAEAIEKTHALGIVIKDIWTFVAKQLAGIWPWLNRIYATLQNIRDLGEIKLFKEGVIPEFLEKILPSIKKYKQEIADVKATEIKLYFKGEWAERPEEMLPESIREMKAVVGKERMEIKFYLKGYLAERPEEMMPEAIKDFKKALEQAPEEIKLNIKAYYEGTPEELLPESVRTWIKKFEKAQEIRFFLKSYYEGKPENMIPPAVKEVLADLQKDKEFSFLLKGYYTGKPEDLLPKSVEDFFKDLEKAHYFKIGLKAYFEGYPKDILPEDVRTYIESFEKQPKEIRLFLKTYYEGGVEDLIPEDVKNYLKKQPKEIQMYLRGEYKGKPEETIPQNVKDFLKSFEKETKELKFFIKGVYKGKPEDLLPASVRTFMKELERKPQEIKLFLKGYYSGQPEELLPTSVTDFLKELETKPREVKLYLKALFETQPEIVVPEAIQKIITEAEKLKTIDLPFDIKASIQSAKLQEQLAIQTGKVALQTKSITPEVEKQITAYEHAARIRLLEAENASARVIAEQKARDIIAETVALIGNAADQEKARDALFKAREADSRTVLQIMKDSGLAAKDEKDALELINKLIEIRIEKTLKLREENLAIARIAVQEEAQRLKGYEAVGAPATLIVREKINLAIEKAGATIADEQQRQEAINALYDSRTRSVEEIYQIAREQNISQQDAETYINELIEARYEISMRMYSEIKSLADSIQSSVTDYMKNLLSGTANIQDLLKNVLDAYRSAFATKIVQMFADATGVFTNMASVFMDPLQRAHYTGIQAAVPLILKAHIDGITAGFAQAQGTQAAQGITGATTQPTGGAGGLFSSISSLFGMGKGPVVETAITGPTITAPADYYKSVQAQTTMMGKATTALQGLGEVAGGLAGAYGAYQTVMAYKGTGKALEGAISGAMSGAMAGMALGPIGAVVGGVIGAVAGGIMGGKKKTTEETKQQTLEITSKINITNKELQIANRNLEGIRRGFEGYILPKSAYFQEREGIEERFALERTRGYYG